MKVSDILRRTKGSPISFHAAKRKKNNPVASKTTRLNNFVDVFGGMAGYSSQNTVNPDSGSIQT